MYDCELCKLNRVEDEFHFLSDCPFYVDERIFFFNFLGVILLHINYFIYGEQLTVLVYICFDYIHTVC